MNNAELDKHLREIGSLEGALCPSCNEPLIPDPGFPSCEGLKQRRYCCPPCRIGVEDGGWPVGVLVTRKRTEAERWIERATGLLNRADEHAPTAFKEAMQAEIDRLSALDKGVDS